MTYNQIKFYESLETASITDFCYNAPKMQQWEAKEKRFNDWITEEQHKMNIIQINKLSYHFDKKILFPHPKVGKRTFYNSLFDVFGSDGEDH